MLSMRKLLFLIVSCGFLLLTSCGQNEQTEETTDWTPPQIAQAVLESQSELPPMTAILAGDELYDSYIEGYYQFNLVDIVDGIIFCADTTSAQEIAVLRLADGTDGDEAKQIFSDYVLRRTGAFTGYLPDEAALVEKASIVVQGDMIALLICREPDLAEAAFQRAFTEVPPDDSVETVNWLPANDAEDIADEDDYIEDETSVSSVSEPDAVPQESEIDTSLTSVPEPETEVTDTVGSEKDTSPVDTEATVETVLDFAPTGESDTHPADMVSPEAPPSQVDDVESEPTPSQTDMPSEPIEPPPSEQAEDSPWTYDPARLLDAWRLGDWSGMAQQDQEILNVCQAVIGRAGFENLSNYEKELFVHDWMLANGRYDTNRLSNLPQYQENPDNDNPYGFLIGGVGICRGYTSTFQLFMDLLGIECISVQGQANSTREEHAWNMVRLDEEWYCVDVTWDDPTTDMPVSTQTAHRYFNVTSAFMRTTGHYWDESSVPEASGTSLSWNVDG